MDKKRKLLNGQLVDDFDQPIDLIIHTKCPGKWKIIDMETGQEYIGDPNPHPEFSKLLIDRVNRGIIGQWKKIKYRITNDII